MDAEDVEALGLPRGDSKELEVMRLALAGGGGSEADAVVSTPSDTSLYSAAEKEGAEAFLRELPALKRECHVAAIVLAMQKHVEHWRVQGEACCWSSCPISQRRNSGMRTALRWTVRGRRTTSSRRWV